MRPFCSLLAFILLGGSLASAADQEWPKWMGPNGDGIATDPIADSWPANGPPKIWEQKVGEGFSSPIALDGKIYLFSQKGSEDALSSFDADSGKPLWSQSHTRSRSRRMPARRRILPAECRSLWQPPQSTKVGFIPMAAEEISSAANWRMARSFGK